MNISSNDNYITFVQSNENEHVSIEFMDCVTKLEVRISVGKLDGVSLTGTLSPKAAQDLAEWLQKWLEHHKVLEKFIGQAARTRTEV